MPERILPVPITCLGCPRLFSPAAHEEALATVKWLEDCLTHRPNAPGTIRNFIKKQQQCATSLVERYNEAVLAQADSFEACPGQWEGVVHGRGYDEEYTERFVACGQDKEITAIAIFITPRSYTYRLEYQMFDRDSKSSAPVSVVDWDNGPPQPSTPVILGMSVLKILIGKSVSQR